MSMIDHEHGMEKLTNGHAPSSDRPTLPRPSAPECAAPPLKIVVLGLSITSSWGNGHATTYRGLLRQLSERGHEILFLERDVDWYASHRDLPNPPYCTTKLYGDTCELKDRHICDVIDADLVIVGSYVPDGVAVGSWATAVARGVTAFYDIDTPVTLQKLRRGDEEYLSRSLLPRFDMYLSFTGGPMLETLAEQYGARRPLPFHCSFDPELYYPERVEQVEDLGYMGTYSDDRQPPLDHLMLEPARRWKEGSFVVAGPQYPASIDWPANLRRIEHLPPSQHRRFYNTQKFTLNITREQMIRAGWSPSVRLFEAAACGTPIISDHWEGLDSFFRIGEEILVSRNAGETLSYLRELDEGERSAIGERGRRRVLAEHTAAHRAAQLESYWREVAGATV